MTIEQNDSYICIVENGGTPANTIEKISCTSDDSLYGSVEFDFGGVFDLGQTG